MNYIGVPLTTTIEIPEIITIHYFEYRSDFSFAGESHDFWEFLCVDKGSIDVTADIWQYTLTRGDIIFHKPGEFHRLEANRKIAPNLVVISFRCYSSAIQFFQNRLLSIDDFERQLLAQIILEAKNTFLDPLGDPFQKQMKKNPHAPIGCEQMIRIHLELFLLHLLRRFSIPTQITKSKEPKPILRKKEEETYQRIVSYMHTHLSRQLTMDDIAANTLIGKSQLQQLIRKRHECGVIHFFSHLKMEQAKQLIRENHLNFTEISESLGYSSIHYFSRQFKNLTGMTPSEYSSSIKSMTEIPKEPISQ